MRHRHPVRRALFGLAVGSGILASRPALADPNPWQRSVRVGVQDGVESVVFSAATEARLEDADGRLLLMLRPRESWTASRLGKSLRLSGEGQDLRVEGPVRVLPSGTPPTLVYCGRKWYRGILEIRPGLVAINELPLEDYLYGVVPYEMPASWPLEALKAQAVAARTYTLANLGAMAAKGYDLKPTTDHQVYGGVAKEVASTNRAVDETRGQTLVYGGKLINAFYCSAAGGYTDNAETVWGTASVPWLQPVPDFDQEAPSYSWQRRLSRKELETALDRHGVRLGALQTLNPLERGFSNRIKRLEIVGTGGRRIVSGEKFRYMTGMKSSLFNVAAVPPQDGKPEGFAFAGRGHGHGLGLSQWGARGLGRMGYGHLQILGHYYPGAQLQQIETAKLPTWGMLASR
ncbi:MAG: SpoIID/LytB domain-containing protein [Candidatus Sericytochromatia bacterium]|nr:SpoIID/LytB domain-containing protein [Candidatus Sericytochromatia bacterium]